METRIAAVTGSNRGLGYSLTVQLLEKGFKVIAFSRSDNSNLKSLKDKYRDKLFPVKMDTAIDSEIQNAYKTVTGITDKIDILINNAAVHLEHAMPQVGDIDFSVYTPSYEVNALGPLKVTNCFLPLVRNGSTKLIVNISSEAGSIEDSERKSEISYCMSKAALNMASKILQNALKGFSIKILAVHPGWFKSDMAGFSDPPITSDEAASNILNTILQKWQIDGPIYIDSKGNEMRW